MKKSIVILLTYLVVSSCGGATITTVKDKDLSYVNLFRILVFANFSDLAARKMTEEALVEQFKLAGVSAIPSIDLFPPVKDYSDKEIFRTLIKNNIDGDFIISARGSKTNKMEIHHAANSFHHGSGMIDGHIFSYSGFSTGGYGGTTTLFQTQMSFDISLFDNETKKIIWVASSLAKESYRLGPDTNLNIIVNELAEAIVSKVMESNLVVRNSNLIEASNWNFILQNNYGKVYIDKHSITSNPNHIITARLKSELAESNESNAYLYIHKQEHNCNEKIIKVLDATIFYRDGKTVKSTLSSDVSPILDNMGDAILRYVCEYM